MAQPNRGGRRLPRPAGRRRRARGRASLRPQAPGAHRLGIHLFPSSSYPFVICVGFLFLGLAAVPFPGPVRIALAVVGLVVFLFGVVGWVVLEDDRMYAAQAVVTHEGPAERTGGHEVAGHAAEEQSH